MRLKDLSKEELIDHYLEEYQQQVRSEKNTVGEGVDDTVEGFPGRTSPEEAVPRENKTEEGMGAEQIYQESQAFVSESIRRAQKGKLPDIGRGKQLVELMMDSIIHESALLLLATDRSQKFSVSTHCVNVAIVGLRIAQTLKYDLHKQIDLGLAALLHEIGIAKVASGTMRRPGRGNPNIQHRPVYSAEILEKLGPEYKWLVETVSQVFEREDGSGVPLGLAGTMICEEAKILGVGDAFEACIHDRPHRKALTGYQFISELTGGATKSFSNRIVKALLDSFSLYPYNEYVLLNTDELGRVVEINPENPLRPMVKVLFDGKGEPLEREVDLTLHPSVYIAQAIAYDSMC